MKIRQGPVAPPTTPVLEDLRPGQCFRVPKKKSQFTAAPHTYYMVVGITVNMKLRPGMKMIVNLRTGRLFQFRNKLDVIPVANAEFVSNE